MTHPKKSPSARLRKGITLIELTVVISIILILITVTYIGASAYKSAADRSSCLINIHQLHSTVRHHQNLSRANPGETITPSDFISANGLLAVMPRCPLNNEEYIIANTYPNPGSSAVTCTTDASVDHIPPSTENW